MWVMLLCMLECYARDDSVTNVVPGDVVCMLRTDSYLFVCSFVSFQMFFVSPLLTVALLFWPSCLC